MELAQTTVDPCIYTALEAEIFVIMVNADDILLAGKSDKQVIKVKEAIVIQLKMKDISELHHFLGVKIIQE